jgi:hypothetical protein
MNCPKLRRMLVHLQGAPAGAYRDMCRWMQRRRWTKRQVGWDNLFFPPPLKPIFPFLPCHATILCEAPLILLCHFKQLLHLFKFQIVFSLAAQVN